MMEQEQLKVLTLVETGTLSADDASLLIHALYGRPIHRPAKRQAAADTRHNPTVNRNYVRYLLQQVG